LGLHDLRLGFLALLAIRFYFTNSISPNRQVLS